MARVGVLALQGGFAAHAAALAEIGHDSPEVRVAADLEQLDGLILPGGESTTQLKLIHAFGLAEPLDRFITSGRPVLATCAGLILAARHVVAPAGTGHASQVRQSSFGWLDVSVARNAWGRQLDSSEAMADDGRTPLVLIRAPRIVEVGDGVEVLLTFRGEPVMVQQRKVTGATFHPELTSDRSIHRRVFGA